MIDIMIIIILQNKNTVDMIDMKIDVVDTIDMKIDVVDMTDMKIDVMDMTDMKIDVVDTIDIMIILKCMVVMILNLINYVKI